MNHEVKVDKEFDQTEGRGRLRMVMALSSSSEEFRSSAEDLHRIYHERFREISQSFTDMDVLAGSIEQETTIDKCAVMRQQFEKTSACLERFDRAFVALRGFHTYMKAYYNQYLAIYPPSATTDPRDARIAELEATVQKLCRPTIKRISRRRAASEC
jgi:hypothetical protein